MGMVSKTKGEYTMNQVDYSRGNGQDDIVCQVKKYGAEICHCTWHPDGSVHCKDRLNYSYTYTNCPLFGDSDCLRK